MTAQKMAEQKLSEIIEREGDANGERSKPYYLAALVNEAQRDLEVQAWTLKAATT